MCWADEKKICFKVKGNGGGFRWIFQYYEKGSHSNKNYYYQYLFFIQCGRCIRIGIAEPYKKHLEHIILELDTWVQRECYL
jgi:hypothetical protein